MVISSFRLRRCLRLAYLLPRHIPARNILADVLALVARWEPDHHHWRARGGSHLLPVTCAITPRRWVEDIHRLLVLAHGERTEPVPSSCPPVRLLMTHRHERSSHETYSSLLPPSTPMTLPPSSPSGAPSALPAPWPSLRRDPVRWSEFVVNHHLRTTRSFSCCPSSPL